MWFPVAYRSVSARPWLRTQGCLTWSTWAPPEMGSPVEPHSHSQSLNSAGVAESTKGRFPDLVHQLPFKCSSFLSVSYVPRLFQARTSQVSSSLLVAILVALAMGTGLCLSPYFWLFFAQTQLTGATELKKNRVLKANSQNWVLSWVKCCGDLHWLRFWPIIFCALS